MFAWESYRRRSDLQYFPVKNELFDIKLFSGKWFFIFCNKIKNKFCHLLLKHSLIRKNSKIIEKAGILIRPNPLNFTAIYRIDSFYKIQKNPICALFSLNILLLWAAFYIHARRKTPVTERVDLKPLIDTSPTSEYFYRIIFLHWDSSFQWNSCWCWFSYLWRRRNYRSSLDTNSRKSRKTRVQAKLSAVFFVFGTEVRVGSIEVSEFGTIIKETCHHGTFTGWLWRTWNWWFTQLCRWKVACRWSWYWYLWRDYNQGAVWGGTEVSGSDTKQNWWHLRRNHDLFFSMKTCRQPNNENWLTSNEALL